MRRNDVASTSFRRHVLTRFFNKPVLFILKSDNIENSRELKGIVLQVPSNQIKVTFIIIFIILPFNLLHLLHYICDFFLFHIEIEDKCGWIKGGGRGAKGMLPPPLSHYWGGGCTCKYLLL